MERNYVQSYQKYQSYQSYQNYQNYQNYQGHLSYQSHQNQYSKKLGIIIFGCPGKGKSTMLNYIKDGKDSGVFKTGFSPFSITRKIQKATFPIYGQGGQEFDFFDLPGINDPSVPLVSWSQQFLQTVSNSKIAFIGIMVNVTDRVDAQVKILGILMDTFLDNAFWENIVIIFSFVNQCNAFTNEYAHKWIDEFNKQTGCKIKHYIAFEKTNKVCIDLAKTLQTIHPMQCQKNPDLDKAFAKITQVIDPELAKKYKNEIDKLKNQQRQMESSYKSKFTQMEKEMENQQNMQKILQNSNNELLKQIAEMKKNKGGCFSLNSFAQFGNNMILFKNLKIGDKVDSWNMNKMTQSDEILCFIDIDEYQIVQFLHLETAEDSITLSPHHLIYCMKDNEASFYFANKVDVGDFLYHAKKGWIQVVKISSKQEIGYSSPLTNSSTIIVNNFYCSCWASIHSQEFAQRGVKILKPIIYLSSFKRQEKGCHWLVEMMKPFTQGWMYQSQKSD